MRKINKKRITILIVLIIAIIFEIVAFKNSRAAKSFDVSAEIIDTEGKLDNESAILPAIAGEAGSYYITLPEVINSKKISAYIVERKDINEPKKKKDEQVKEEEVENNSDNNETTNEILSNNKNSIDETNSINNIEENKSNSTTEENIVEDETIQEADTDEELVDTDEVKILSPNEPLYLSKSEIKDKKITIKVEYITFEKDNQVLYEQQISTDVDDNLDGTPDNKITIDGFMPLYSSISVKPLTEEEINDSIKDMLNDKVTFTKAYDIKIISNDQEYEPTDFDTQVRVSIAGVEQLDEKTQKYKVVHIDDNKKPKEVERC